MEIVYKSKRFIVINKPYGMPSQKDPSGDVDAMSETERFLRENGERSDLWLVHRLDRVVSGLMVFARTKESAAALSKAIQDRLFKKVYLAVVEGECPDSGEMHDLLFKDSNSSKAFIVDRKRTGVKEASLSYRTIARTDVEKRTLSLVSVILDTGRFHQIRSQFAHRKMPLACAGC